MNRFIVFAGEQYYPIGGLRDLKGTAENLIEAMQIDISIVYLGGPVAPDWGYIAEYDGKDFNIIKTWDTLNNTWKDVQE